MREVERENKDEQIFLFVKLEAHFRVGLYSDAVLYITVKYIKSLDSIPLEGTIKHPPSIKAGMSYCLLQRPALIPTGQNTLDF